MEDSLCDTCGEFTRVGRVKKKNPRLSLLKRRLLVVFPSGHKFDDKFKLLLSANDKNISQKYFELVIFDRWFSCVSINSNPRCIRSARPRERFAFCRNANSRGVSTICEKDRKYSERERERRAIAKREIGGRKRRIRGGGDSLPGPILIVPGNEGVIK